MKRYLLKLAYDGTGFVGWQSQQKGRTVQQEIERILAEIAKTKIRVTGAGRTDTGVHALAQRAHFDFDSRMSTVQILKAMRSMSPADIQIIEVIETPPGFNARYDAVLRTYEYIITCNPTPFNRLYKTHFKGKKIIPQVMADCLPHFLREHDFTSFSRYNPLIRSPLCRVTDFRLTETSEDLILEISANRFLHNMVRRLVGTIVNISHSGVSPGIIPALLAARSTQNKLISTAPAHGLYLKEVFYPEFECTQTLLV